ncbi:MAG TPA: hypothetical protein VJ697_16455 [Nitrososphaeraceae archaeon]|nr:hypothetical protein [Nitrososphaeraceae archaeon]
MMSSSGTKSKGEKIVSTIEGVEIADPKYVFRGLTYGQWVAIRWNDVLSAQPDKYYDPGRGMVFLRGGFDTSYRETDPIKRIYAVQTKGSRIKISQDTALLVPIITTTLVKDDTYQGVVLKDEISLRYSARLDTVNGGDLFARIKKKPDDKVYKLVDDLNDYIIETEFFPLLVDENSPYKDIMDGKFPPGPQYAVSVGVYVIISKLPLGTFRIEFGGKGVGKYFTHSIYDIEVIEPKVKLNDISDAGSLMGKWDENFATKRSLE